jgi:IMP dehydrogenase
MSTIDGFSGETLFGQGKFLRTYQIARLLTKRARPGFCYTYDDVIFHPGFIDFAADQVCMQSF